ncbi:hypothetical protein M758_6G119700 [Ceratodon purpureus]|uniref:Uncharacterized protein n=1 Tax=Ceratodon purpureus TaxID=3225 RepID=A0A8T0HF52_CERPU|nr:hypothetical protein KC19_6G124400 [Ceratodon purpureus]KAG0613657.1 hypothetical protein M758_6G119700 [Ceratodon purpureus]
MEPDFAIRHMFSGKCDTTECAEKVEAMLSTAILHQEDVWNMLVENAPEGAVSVDPLTGETSTVAVDPKVLKAMKQKLENAIDWCQLAQTRLKSLVSNQAQ